MDVFPLSLTSLTFGFDFDRPVDSLSCSLTHLTFGTQFNHSVDHLPPSLTHLYFGDMFNQSIDTLPPSLTYLKLGMQFNQSVNSLPASLTFLLRASSTSNQFSSTLSHPSFFYQTEQLHPVDSLPSSLTHLRFGKAFDQSVTSLPLSLIDMEFFSESSKQLELHKLLRGSVGRW